MKNRIFIAAICLIIASILYPPTIGKSNSTSISNLIEATNTGNINLFDSIDLAYKHEVNTVKFGIQNLKNQTKLRKLQNQFHEFINKQHH